MTKNINFVSSFKKANLASILIFILSLFLIFFKGLNYGIDFKGGTLIELRADNTIEITSIRDILSVMDLGDINVKKVNSIPDHINNFLESNKDSKFS